MARLTNPEAYKKTRIKDIETTIEIINEVDKGLIARSTLIRCSDKDSVEIEVKDKHLIKIEFSTGLDRGVGQTRMWRNGAKKRYTTTIVAYRNRPYEDIFCKIEIYSHLHNGEVKTTIGRFEIKDISQLALNIFDQI